MIDLLLCYLTIFILSALVIFFAVNMMNILTVHIIERNTPELDGVLVSVLIPARNEEQNIVNCLESLKEQTYSNLEIIVIDDNSNDNTLNLCKNFMNKMNLKLINGKELPDGWLGKNFACHQLQQNASGKYLLFTDADTVYEKDAIGKAVSFIKQKQCDLLSVMPEEITVSFWERVIIPVMHFVVYTLLPLKLVENTNDPRFVMANGQFMLFTREMYDRTGGHYALRNKIVEDVWFGKSVKQSGGKLIFGNGRGILSCRMYENYEQVIKGFTKNLFPGLSFSFPGLVAVLGLFFIVYVLPLPLLIYSFLTQNYFILSLSFASLMIAILIRLTQAYHFVLPKKESFLHVLSVVMFIYIGLRSYFSIRSGAGAEWKGRVYTEKLMKDE